MKPERAEIFQRARGLVDEAARIGKGVVDTTRQAGDRMWDRLTAGPDERTRRRKALILLGGGIAAIIAILAIASRLGGENATHRPVSTVQAVSVVTAELTPFNTSISLNGEARPVRDIQVAAPASGVRILEILVDEGDMVRAGQPMARLDTNVALAQIRAAEAGVAEAEAAAVRARGEYERAEAIRDSGALSAEAIEQRRAAAVAADARLTAARAQLQEINARLGGGFVRAPASGLVIGRTAEVGRNVDGQILFRIAADNRLEVAAQVAERDALALQDGQTAIFTLVDGSTVEGRLRRAPAAIDSRTRTGEALFSLPAGTRVRAGMYVRGLLQLPTRNVIAAPQSSVLYTNGQAYVFALGEDNRARRVDITLGGRDGDMVEIASGLTAGQRIVGAGGAFLTDGEAVRPVVEAPARPDTGIRGREG